MGADSLIGGGDDNSLAGGNDGDTLDGGTGEDTLDGGSGIDKIFGGDGDDTYIVDSSGDEVTDDWRDRHRHGQSDVDYSLGAGIENLTLVAGTTGKGNGWAIPSSAIAAITP